MFAEVPLALWTGRLDRAEVGIAALQRNLGLRNNAVWHPQTRFFEAVLRHARGERGTVGEMSRSLDDLLETRFVTRAPMFLGMLAEALLAEGLAVEAQARIDDAAMRLEQYRERWCRPEVLRIQGLIHMANGDRAAAQVRFVDAIAEADALGALSLELRAARDMARCLATEGRRNEAFGILDRTCAKFTEKGPDTEVVSAQALLDTLA